MQELINAILAGTLSNVEIATQINDKYNELVDENDQLIEQVESNNWKHATLQSELEKSKEEVASTILAMNKMKSYGTLIAAEFEEVKGSYKALQDDLVIAKAQASEVKAYKATVKKLKPQVLRLQTSNQSLLTRNERLLREKGEVDTKLNTMCRENAKLRMTGHKKIGEYNCTIFPVRLQVTDDVPQIGLVIYNDTGAMKVLTRNDETREIYQPRSHNFKIKGEVEEWIQDFFDVVESEKHMYTDKVLKLVN